MMTASARPMQLWQRRIGSLLCVYSKCCVTQLACVVADAVQEVSVFLFNLVEFGMAGRLERAVEVG